MSTPNIDCFNPKLQLAIDKLLYIRNKYLTTDFKPKEDTNPALDKELLQDLREYEQLRKAIYK